MKYVIFKKGMLIVPVVSSEQSTHSELKAGSDFKPVSAGFFCIKNGFVLLDKRGSESLNLMPNENDTNILQMMIDDYTTSFFLDFDNNYGL